MVGDDQDFCFERFLMEKGQSVYELIVNKYQFRLNDLWKYIELLINMIDNIVKYFILCKVEDDLQ